VIDVDETFYFKPDAGKLLGSPADETPVPPQDIQPEELDIAIAVDRIEKAAQFRVGRIDHRWAGLRSFVDDKSIVIGEATDGPGFVWVAAQGGYGIMTSPAAGRIAAAMVLGEAFPADVEDLGISAADVAPARLG
jgi:D-arginine dehydrogenase